ncbi:hypothetical protein [Nocardia thailandica]|uniref:hypothetical protein n=1 Tax=Nocardia thailandica TaxID=257275 RepID=UPI0002E7547D|nr:hypothetical protein [Nocardia thailandica]
MTTTTAGTWNNRVDSYAVSVGQTIIESLGEFANEYDIDAIEGEYRAAIDAALPEGLQLVGDEFIAELDADYSGYPASDDGRLDIKAIVDEIDFWAIAEKHEAPSVWIYEDNSGAVYMERGGDAWAIGPVTGDLEGQATEHAKAWNARDWEPSEDDGQTRIAVAQLADLVHIATWNINTGLDVERDAYSDPVAGAGGRAFLGVDSGN